MATGPQQLRQQQRHEEKLKAIREQVAEGKLVIRKMTAAERKRYPRLDEGSRARRPRA
jgi:signal recognition particle GTPase